MKPGQLFKPTSNKATALILNVTKETLVIKWLTNSDGSPDDKDQTYTYDLTVMKRVLDDGKAVLEEAGEVNPNLAFLRKRF